MAPPKRKNKRRKRLTFHEKRWNPSHQKSKEKSEVVMTEEEQGQVSESEEEVQVSECEVGEEEKEGTFDNVEEEEIEEEGYDHCSNSKGRSEEKKEKEEEEEESCLFFTSEEEDKDEDWTPPSSSHSSSSSRKRKRMEEKEEICEDYEEKNKEMSKNEKREKGECSSTEEEDSSFELPQSQVGGTLGAKMMTPPKKLSKMPHLQKATSSLDDLLKDMGGERKKKIKEKERFEDAGWRRIADLGKWRWTYHKVPSDRRELVIDMEGQGRKGISSLKIFSLYFSDDLLSYLMEQREDEMAQFWSPSGYGLTLNLQMVKQVYIFYFR